MHSRTQHNRKLCNAVSAAVSRFTKHRRYTGSLRAGDPGAGLRRPRFTSAKGDVRPATGNFYICVWLLAYGRDPDYPTARGQNARRRSKLKAKQLRPTPQLRTPRGQLPLPRMRWRRRGNSHRPERPSGPIPGPRHARRNLGYGPVRR